MPPTLVIIDMQSDYPIARNQNLIAEIVAEIERQRAINGAIILVEYLSNGRTVLPIKMALWDYPYLFVEKRNVDGSTPILFALEYQDSDKFNKNDFNLCGVYTTCCVYGTGAGLIKAGKNVKLLLYACSDGYGEPPITENDRKFGVMGPEHFQFAA